MDLYRHIKKPQLRRPALSLSAPLLALVPILCSLTITTWFFPRELGYVLTGGSLLLVAAYGVLNSEIRPQLEPSYLVLIGGYWLGLLVHYWYAPHPEIVPYILVTPVAVVATVIVLPALIATQRQTFTMGLTLVAVGLVVVGLSMLWQETQTSENLYQFVGDSVMGIDGIRIVSIFHNPNTYGFVMMIGSLAALYTYMVRRGVIWFGALALCLIGLFLSEGDAALVGFTVGAVLVLSGPDRRLGLLGLSLATLGVYLAIRTGHVGDVMETTLLSRVDRWVASLERLAQDPMLGIGFADTAAEIGTSGGPHNSYIYPLLNTGLIAGSLYLGSLVYALGQGIRKRWTAWTGFVVGLTVAIFLFMGFESLFLGGLSVSSIMLGVCLGLLLYSSDTATDTRSSSSS